MSSENTPQLPTSAWQPPQNWAARCLAMLLLATCLVAGCAPSVVVKQLPTEEENLRAVSKVYTIAARDLGHPPANLDELKKSFPTRAGNPDHFLTSSRDGKPYTILWGVDVAGKYRGSTLPLAYEQDGADGFRYFANCRGEVGQLDDAAFTAQEFPAHKEKK